MKMHDNIDQIFLQGLNGKASEKPDEFWEDLYSNILDQSLPQRWWKTKRFLFISMAVAIVSALVLFVWLHSKPKAQNPVPKQPTINNTEVLPMDASGKTNDELEEKNNAKSQQNTTTDQNAAQRTNEPTKKATQPPLNEQPSPKTELNDDKSSSMDDLMYQAPAKTAETPKEILNPTTEINTSDTITSSYETDSLTNKSIQAQSNEVIPKKNPVVIIVQDTIVVTDTIKTSKRHK